MDQGVVKLAGMDRLADIIRFGELSNLELQSSIILVKQNFLRTLLQDAEAGMNFGNNFFRMCACLKRRARSRS